LEEALRFSTRTTLAVGQPADVVALDADPQWLMGALSKDMAKASDALRDVPVALTICRGVVTHQALLA
jgi:predicted amidohydrolase YtcJ